MAVETLDESATVESLLTTIFDSMDTDQSKSLSDGELREGMAAYGLSLSHDDLQTISDYIMREGLEGELTLSQWLEFAKASEGELPQPGDEDAPTVGEAEQPGGGTFETESFETENVENPVKRQSALKLGSADEV